MPVEGLSRRVKLFSGVIAVQMRITVSHVPLVERYRLIINYLSVFLLHSSWSRKTDKTLCANILHSTRSSGLSEKLSPEIRQGMKFRSCADS